MRLLDVGTPLHATLGLDISLWLKVEPCLHLFSIMHGRYVSKSWGMHDQWALWDFVMTGNSQSLPHRARFTCHLDHLGPPVYYCEARKGDKQHCLTLNLADTPGREWSTDHPFPGTRIVLPIGPFQLHSFKMIAIIISYGRPVVYILKQHLQMQLYFNNWSLI